MEVGAYRVVGCRILRKLKSLAAPHIQQWPAGASSWFPVQTGMKHDCIMAIWLQNIHVAKR